MGVKVSTHPLLMREVNARVLQVLTGLGLEDGDFACECSDESCTDTMQLTLREYAARDGEPLLIAGHTHISQ